MLINKLNSIVMQTAEGVNNILIDLKIEHYKMYLNNMYHYTINSHEQLMEASVKMAFIKDRTLEDLFSELAKEEEKHYILAELDLSSMNEKPTRFVPDSVKNIHSFWNEISAENAICYLGVMYVFENIAHHLNINLLNDTLTRLQLNKSKTRFIMTHLHEDARHGALILCACERIHDNNQQEAIVDAAKEAANLWLRMHLLSEESV